MIDFTDLRALLERELDHCQLLQTVLLKERELIERQQLGELPAILRQKADLLTSIEHTFNQKQDWLSSKKLPLELSSFTLLAINGQAFADCLNLWAESNAVKLSCNESNTTNGIIIAKSRKRNSQQLEILKGSQPSKPLYDAAGKTISGSSKGDTRLA